MYINKDLHVLVACSSPSVSWDLSCSVNPVGELHCLVREVLGFLGLLIWPIFDLVFQFLLSKAAAFRFWCLVRFVGFLQFSLWLSVFVARLFFLDITQLG